MRLAPKRSTLWRLVQARASAHSGYSDYASATGLCSRSVRSAKVRRYLAVAFNSRLNGSESTFRSLRTRDLDLQCKYQFGERVRTIWQAIASGSSNRPTVTPAIRSDTKVLTEIRRHIFAALISSADFRLRRLDCGPATSGE